MFSEKGDWAYYAADIDANGRFNLFRKNTSDPQAEPEKISDAVLDYAISKDGRQVIKMYLVILGIKHANI